MSRTIFIHNKSSHPQEFQVNGWNINKKIVVKARSRHNITAASGSSGAIIALHGGHEGEQAEITKNGFGGNDFFDLSNIVGAGGNMTVQQVGDPRTLKGDPLFMQHLNHAFKNASKERKDKSRKALHFDQKGNIVRLEPIKFHPEVEPLIRTFADGKTYIGVGAWNGSPGNKSDNDQSRAGYGNKDIIVTYNDGDASPDGNHVRHRAQLVVKGLGNSIDSSDNADAKGEVDGDLQDDADGEVTAGQEVSSGEEVIAGDGEEDPNPNVDGNSTTDSTDGNPPAHASFLNLIAAADQPASDTADSADGNPPARASFNTLVAAAVRPTNGTADSADGNPPVHASFHTLVAAAAVQPARGDHDDGKKPGIILHNRSKSNDTYFFFDNYWNGNGTAGANFDKPLKSVTVASQQKAFVSLPLSFKGRVQRGRLIPATWAEFQLKAANDGAAHGDISIQQGNDGPATISSTDGSRRTEGFTQHLVHLAPAAARVKRSDGVLVLASTEGNWMGPPNRAAIDFQRPRIGKSVYVVGGTGVPDVASKNNRLAVDFY